MIDEFDWDIFVLIKCNKQKCPNQRVKSTKILSE